MMNYKRLTFDGVNDLYLHPTFGARTLQNIAEMEEVRRNLPPPKPAMKQIQVSDAMALRNERCIDEHGCSEALW